MTEELISLNPKFKELLLQFEGNTIGRKQLILSAEDAYQLSNIQAKRFVARNIHSLTTQKLIEATGEKKSRSYLLTPQLLSTLQKRVKITCNPTIDERTTSELINEEIKTSAELRLILGEIEAYQEYLIKFPENNKTILSLLNKTRDRASDFYGRLNAITKIIQATEKKDHSIC